MASNTPYFPFEEAFKVEGLNHLITGVTILKLLVPSTSTCWLYNGRLPHTTNSLEVDKRIHTLGSWVSQLSMTIAHQSLIVGAGRVYEEDFIT